MLTTRHDAGSWIGRVTLNVYSSRSADKTSGVLSVQLAMAAGPRCILSYVPQLSDSKALAVIALITFNKEFGIA